MYNEIYKGLIEILTKRGEEGYEYLDDTIDIAKILSLNLNFDPLNIFAVREVELDGMPNILYILASTPSGNTKDFYTEYIMYRGKVVKAILINALAITTNDSVLIYDIIANVCRESCLMLLHHYKSLIELVPERSYTISTVGVYASSVLLVKLMDRYIDYNNLGDEEKIEHDYLLTISIYKINNITLDLIGNHSDLSLTSCTVVKTIRKAIEQVGVGMLLDNSLWMYTNNKQQLYPGARFLDCLFNKDEEEDD